MSLATEPQRKTPVRTCVSCGTSGAKQDLVRMVRSKDGMVQCDEQGRAAGRGAYVCARVDCFAEAVSKGRFNRALKCSLSKEDYERLEETFTRVCNKRAQTS